MGTLVLSSNPTEARTLESEQTLGRTESCEIRLRGAHVSGKHAELRWLTDSWQLKDLGSLNGTFVNGLRIRPGEWVRLDEGTRIAFGNPGDPPWVLGSADAPVPTLVSLDGAASVAILEGIVGIPVESPMATVSVDADGQWWLEGGSGEPSRIRHNEVFTVAGKQWRLSDGTAPNFTTPLGASFSVADTALQIEHSSDEENVEIAIISHGHTFSLGSRQHHFLLLLLARKRLRDREAGLPEHSCGWIYLDELTDQVRIDRVHLNLHVYRIRRQFSAAGCLDPLGVIERRVQTRELRIGFSRFDIRAG